MTCIVNKPIPEATTHFVSASHQGNKLDVVIDYYQHSRLSIYASDVEASELSIGGDVDASPVKSSP